MVIKNRLFPYPVLCGDTDDYSEKCEFALEPRLKELTHELVFQYDYIVRCDALENLIRKGQAEYVLHIECSSTSFRIALKSTVPHIEYRLNKSRVNGEINLVAMIVARTAVSDFTSSELNEDYAGEKISFKKGDILAYQNLPPIYVSKKTDELAKNEAFFTVVKQASLDQDEIMPLSFNLDNPKIQILVDTRTYEAFIRFQQTSHIAMAMLVLPALTYMISEIGDRPERFRQYQWFQRLEKYYHSLGKDFINDILGNDDNPVIIAQEMLQNPVSFAYRELYALEE